MEKDIRIFYCDSCLRELRNETIYRKLIDNYTNIIFCKECYIKYKKDVDKLYNTFFKKSKLTKKELFEFYSEETISDDLSFIKRK